MEPKGCNKTAEKRCAWLWENFNFSSRKVPLVGLLCWLSLSQNFGNTVCYAFLPSSLGVHVVMCPWGRMDKARAGEGWGGSGETWWGQNLSCGAQSVGPVLQGLCLWTKGFGRVEAIGKPHSLVFGTTHCWLAEPTLKWSIVIGQYFWDVIAGGRRWR